MAEKTFNTRIQQKHDSQTNWDKATNFIPKAGEIIIYDADNNNAKPRIKIGNGISKLSALPFITNNADITAVLQTLDYSGATASGNATSFITQVTQTDGVVSATKASIPVAGSGRLGLIKSGTDISVDTSGNVSIVDNSHNHTSANISDLSTTITNAITGAINALNATDPTADGTTGTSFIATINQSNGVVTATKKSIPTANSTTLGLVKGGGDVTISNGVITINDDSHYHVISNVDGLQTALDAKATPENITTAIKALSYGGAIEQGNATSFITQVSQENGVISAAKASVPIATSTQPGLVRSGTDITVDSVGNVSVNNNSHTHISSNITDLGSTINNAISGAIGALDASDPTASGTSTTFIKTISQTDGAITATKASIPTANGTTLGMVKQGGDVTITSGFIYVNDDSHNHVISNIDGLQDALNAKATPANISSAIGALDFTGATADGNDISFITQVTQNDGLVRATKATVPIATADQLGLVKSGTDITVDSYGNVSVVNNSHSHISTNITDLDSTIGSAITTAIRALDASSPTASSTTSTSFIDTVSQTDGVISATKKTIPTANGTTTLGMVKGGGDVTISNGVITVNDNSHSHTSSNISDLSTTINTAVTNAIGALDASDPTASGTATQFITSISQKDGVITATKANITAAALGLSGAMRFLGTSSTAISDGSTTSTIVIGGVSTGVTAGSVVLYNGKEYVWTGSIWEELGTEGSYKVQQTQVYSPIASGTTSAFIDTISQNSQGVITATKKNLPTASSTTAGITLVYSAEQCGTFNTDSGACTPAAAKKATELFALSNLGGTLGGDLLMSNGSTSQNGQPAIQWRTVSANTPFIGYASDRYDGTFVVTSLKGTKYTTGLAIDGGTDSLLWKGVKVATINDFTDTGATSVEVTGSGNAITSASYDASTRKLTLTKGATYNNYTYTLPNATSSTLGGVKIGSNISVSSGTISLTQANVISALGYTPPTTAITSVTAGNGLTGGGTSGSVTLNIGAGSGISVAADTVSVNTSYTTSGKNYKVQVDSASGGLFVNVPWTDNDTTYTQGTGISISGTTISNSGVRSVTESTVLGCITVDTNGNSTQVAVNGLASAAYMDSSAFATPSMLSSYLPLSGGSLNGRTYSSVTVANNQSSFRNIQIISPGTSVTAGSTSIPTGEIWIRYEE